MNPKTRQDVEFMRILASTAVSKREREQRQEQERLQAEADAQNEQQLVAIHAKLRRESAGRMLGVHPDTLSQAYADTFLEGFHEAGQ